MREIKFRGWDGQDILQPDHVVMEPGPAGYVHLSHSIKVLNQATYEWMQYTGLKDDHGVEIYEGDIIKQAYGNEIITYPVKWDNGEHRFTLGYNIGTREVIGNIYQNPELLEGGDAN